uniref:Gem-associated protein 6 Sm-like domain-containing protein n=1 Tax=Sinocyclocheilus rhinocerous TaxID=307959 RepID=A0A673JQA7_9TELE
MPQWSARSPRHWHEFINHEVCVTAGDQQRFEGRVFTVDPVSRPGERASVGEGDSGSRGDRCSDPPASSLRAHVAFV